MKRVLHQNFPYKNPARFVIFKIKSKIGIQVRDNIDFGIRIRIKFMDSRFYIQFFNGYNPLEDCFLGSFWHHKS